MIIFISVSQDQQDTANQWVVDNVDPNGANTFIQNFTDSQGNPMCLISIPDDGSDYSEAMKAQFGYSETDPRINNN